MIEDGNGRPSTIAGANLRTAIIVGCMVFQAIFFAWFGDHIAQRIESRVVDNQKLILKQGSQLMDKLNQPDMAEHVARDVEQRMESMILRMKMLEDKINAHASKALPEQHNR